jgi:hypothetical protein
MCMDTNMVSYIFKAEYVIINADILYETVFPFKRSKRGIGNRDIYLFCKKQDQNTGCADQVVQWTHSDK